MEFNGVHAFYRNGGDDNVKTVDFILYKVMFIEA